MESCYTKTKKWLGSNLLLVLTFFSVVLGLTLGLSLRVLQPSQEEVTLTSPHEDSHSHFRWTS